MLPNFFKYINYNDLKKFASDFKAVYKAPNESAALSELEGIKEKWGKKYPYAISNWENNWEDVNSFFQFPDDIRRIMYTTYTDQKTIPTFLGISADKGILLKNVGIIFDLFLNIPHDRIKRRRDPMMRENQKGLDGLIQEVMNQVYKRNAKFY